MNYTCPNCKYQWCPKCDGVFICPMCGHNVVIEEEK